jgi:capsular exopolysaccharide synthesis family protein
MVLYPPTIIKSPVYPKVGTIYLTAFGVAFLSFVVILVLGYYTHNTIDNVGELEKLTKATILGIIPKYSHAKLENSKLIVHLNNRSPVSEALRSIRTALEFMIPKDDGTKIISVTSTISGEGKTFISVNLAAIIAMTGTKVIILDLDMRKSKLHLAFDSENDKGMSNLLIGKATLDEVIKKSPIENYHYICAGPNPPNPSELLISDKFNEIIAELKLRYEVIFIDSPPVGLVTDGIIIMKKSDFQIYVVRSEYSKKGFEKCINNLLTKGGYQKIGVVLNCFDNKADFGYGYRYGYGYGYGYEYYSEKTANKKIWKKVLNVNNTN